MNFRLLFLFLLPFAAIAQQIRQVDFKTMNATITIDPVAEKVSGNVEYAFDVLSLADTIRIDAMNMQFSDVRINGKKADFVSSANALKLFNGYKKGKNKVSFSYSAMPRQTMYFTGSGNNRQIWTQGQGKNTSHWLPSFDDANEKVIFNLSFTLSEPFTVISNGLLKSKKKSKAATIWKYKMNYPMSSYLVMVAAGQFDHKTEKSASGTPLEMYFRPEDQSRVASTYRHSKEIFDFLESEIGIKYPWQVYKQVPVRDFIYAGMENTSATVFAQDYVVDSIGFNDMNYINVNAHELAHQWFGDMVTSKSGKHHWLQEGFATYYALLAERSLYGDDHFYWAMYNMAENLQRAAATDTIPILNEKASSLTFYRKGAWALHILREGVGAAKFRLAIKNYLQKYGFTNVDTDDFLGEINKVSDYDTAAFRKVWLEKGGFEVGEALGLLKKNSFMRSYFDLVDLQEVPFAEKKEKLEQVIGSSGFYPLAEEAISQLQNVAFEDKLPLLEKAMASKDFKVRQAVAKTLQVVPEAFYNSYISLLDDPSYVTREIALNVIWQQFPAKRIEILEKSKDWIGFNDKNLRMQWLTMALVTPEYQKAMKPQFYDELLAYASPAYESNVRQNALENLLYINPNDKNALRLLVNPLTHFRWQFSKFAREKIRELIKNPAHKTYFTSLVGSLPQNEQFQLKRLLDEK